MALRLIIEDEEGATTIVPLGEEEITIGREPGNTIQLTEQNVSRQHARLTPGSDGWVIEDLDSYNGVKVNGVLIEGSVTLHEGDVVQIGDYHLAITNNAEQTTLNLERPSGLTSTEPMRAAPSVDLPRIPAAEAAALISGGPAPAATPVTTVPETDAVNEPPQEGKGRGLLVALILLLLIGGGFAAYQFLGPQKPTPKPPEVTKADPPPTKIEPPTPDPKPPETKVAPPPEQPPPEQPPPEVQPPVEPDPPVEPIKKVTPKGDKGPKGDRGDKGDKPKGEPKQTEPKGDPVQLLEEARKANFANNATQAYELAKKSYEIDKNVNALAIMGGAACKMGDAAKAKAAYAKLTDPSRRKQMVTVCAERGIMLE